MLSSIVVAVFALSLAFSPAAGSADLSPSWGQPSLEQLAELSDARSQSLESETGLSEESRKRIKETYENVNRVLQNAREFEQRRAELESLPATAPERIQELRRELAEQRAQLTTAPPEADSEESVPQLEQRLFQEQTELAALRSRFQERRSALEQDEKRPLQAISELGTAKQKLEEIERDLGEPTPTSGDARLVEAQRTLLQARYQARLAEIRALEQELATHDLRQQLLAAENDALEYQVTQIQGQVTRLEEVLAERQRAKAEAVRQEAEEAERGAADKHPALRALLEQNADWSRQLADTVAGRTRVSRERAQLRERIRRIEREYANAQQRLQIAGLSEILGQMLRKQRLELPDQRSFRKRAQRREALIAELGLARIKTGERLAQIETEAAALAAERNNDGLAEPDPLLLQTQAELSRLLAEQRQLLNDLKTVQDSQLRELVELDYEELQLVTLGKQYADFLDERLLWIRSDKPFGADTWQDLGATLRWLLDPRQWASAVWTLVWELGADPALSVLVLIAALGLWRRRKRLLKQQSEATRRIHRPSTDSFSYTLQATGIALLHAAPVPLLVGYAGWQLSGALEVGDFPRAVGNALLACSVPLFIVFAFWRLIKPNGVCETHLRWRPEILALFRRYLPAFLLFALPVLFLITMLSGQTEISRQNGLARSVFITGMLALAVFVYRLLWSKEGIIHLIQTGNPESWPARLRFLWGVPAVGIPVALALLSGLGYHYSATQLIFAVRDSLRLLLGLALARSLILRAFLVEKRRLLLSQILERRQASQQAEGPQEGAAHKGEFPGQEELAASQLDLDKMMEQSRRLVHTLFGWALVLALWAIWADVLPALRVLDQTTLWNFTVVEAGQESLEPFTLADLMLVAVIGVVVAVAGRNLPGILEIALLQRLPITKGGRYAVKTLIQYLVVGLGLIYMFQALGLRWSQIQWLVAALSVGLGFGLQEIFANFISGLIILFERPIRVGDTITVGDVTGTVSRVQIRATTVRDWDRKELVVPNKSFITERVINWTLSDPVTRLVIRVGVAYGTDTNRVRDIILQVVQQNPLVMQDPAPTLYFEQFGDSSLNLVLRVFVRELEQRMPVTHDLHTAINEALQKNSVKIPFPQQDVHLYREQGDPADP